MIAIRFKNFKVTLNIKQVDSNYKIEKIYVTATQFFRIKKSKKVWITNSNETFFYVATFTKLEYLIHKSKHL